jgi:hypothetical protein
VTSCVARLLVWARPSAREQVEQIARELVVRDSMVYLDGKHYEGLGPGLRTERRPAPASVDRVRRAHP